MLSHVRTALARLRELFHRRSRFAAEQDEEFSFHMEMETAENIRRGMGQAEAKRAALLRFGGRQRFREETSDARGVVALDNLVRDTRFALRRLKRAPAFSAGVIATLGIGIGAAVGIGTIVYDVLLRDLPYDRPDRLVHVGFHTDGVAASGDLHSEATFVHFALSARSFSDLGAYWTSDAFALTDRDAAERVTVALMSPSTFDVLGVRPLLGALFQRKDTSWVGVGDQFLPVLISQGLWERRYGADPAIIGRVIDIDHGPRVVIGVLPRSFQFPAPSVSVWYPTNLSVKRPQIAARGLTVIGRLRDGVTMTQAETELNALLSSLPTRFPQITPELLRHSRARVSVESLESAIVAPVRMQLVILGVLVAVILLIATANVVNLFLLRAERTSHEIAVALALGASRLALAQRFVVDGIVLGLAAGVVAIPAAALALSTKFGFTEREIPRLHEVSFAGPTIALIVASAALIGGTVGLIGLTRTDVAELFDRLRAIRASPSRGWRRARNGLVALQVAIALTLLVAAGLLGRSFWNLRRAHIGFEPANAMTFQVSLPWGPSGITTYADQAAFHARVTERLATLPGVTSVGGALYLPLTGRGTLGYPMRLSSGDDAGRPAVPATGNLATADYFRTMGIPLRAGRSFRSGDLRGVPGVILSERLATSIFGTTDVIGRSIARLSPLADTRPMPFRVVGVVGDVQQNRIEDGYTPMAYYPLLRDGDGLPAESTAVPYRPEELQFVIRGTQLPDAPTIRRIVSELDRRVPAANIRTLGSIVDDATAHVRLTMLLIVVAGAAALLLGVIGVYSVVSYAAAERMREFGIRLALGAAPMRVGGMVLANGLRPVAIGTLFGLVAALATTRFLRAFLYEVKPTSVAEFGFATVLLIVVTLLATLVPARRAARTHPAVVLRGD